MTQNEIQMELKEMINWIVSNNLNHKGYFVIGTFNIETDSNGTQYFDTEIMIPLNDPIIDVKEKYEKKVVFCIIEAIKATHYGGAEKLPDTLNKMTEFIEKKKYQQNTIAYTKQEFSKVRNGEFIVECYIGVSKNKL